MSIIITRMLISNWLKTTRRAWQIIIKNCPPNSVFLCPNILEGNELEKEAKQLIHSRIKIAIGIEKSSFPLSFIFWNMIPLNKLMKDIPVYCWINWRMMPFKVANRYSFFKKASLRDTSSCLSRVSPSKMESLMIEMSSSYTLVYIFLISLLT